MVATPATDTGGDQFDGLLFRHFSDFSVMNVLYMDGHVEPINYKQMPSGVFNSLDNYYYSSSWQH